MMEKNLGKKRQCIVQFVSRLKIIVLLGLTSVTCYLQSGNS